MMSMIAYGALYYLTIGSQLLRLRIDLNNERNLTESVKLDYLNPQTIVQNDPSISGKRVHFSIYAAEGTKLPPILNALELFQ